MNVVTYFMRLYLNRNARPFLTARCIYVVNMPTEWAGIPQSGTATSYGAERSGDRIQPIPVAKRSKARVCGRSLAGIAGSNLTGVIDVLCCVL
jgi:hypothetical protein